MGQARSCFKTRSPESAYQLNKTHPCIHPYIVVGGGTASGYAIKTLLEEGVDGSDILLLCGERSVPYERPALTKAFLHAPNCKVRARLPGFHTCVGGGGERQTLEWYTEKNVKFELSTIVDCLDVTNKTLSCCSKASNSGQMHFSYDKLLLATGCSSLNPDPDLYCGNNVYPIRSEEHAISLVEKMEQGKGQKLVIIGGGYIGVEVAAAALGWIPDGYLESVTIINMDDMLLHRVFASAPEFATFLQDRLIAAGKCFGEKKITILNSAPIKSLEKDVDGAVTSVVLRNGDKVPADILVLGMGARPNTSFVPANFKDSRGYVKADGSFSFAPDAFAFGDCASFPLVGTPTVLEHVAHARASAKHAACSAMGKTNHNPYTLLPFFYSRILEYTETPLIWNMWGNLDVSSPPNPTVAKKDNGLAALWVSGNTVIAACLMMQSPAPTQQQLDTMKALVGGQPPADLTDVLEQTPQPSKL